jgi:tetratricopeptide (TPR) repeat protein
MLERDTGKLAGQAQAFLESGNLSQARALCEQVCQINKGDSGAWKMLATINAEAGNITEAIACLRRVTSLRPRSADAHWQLANALLHQGELKKALVSYQNVVKQQPGFAKAWLMLGRVSAQLGRLKKAESSYRQALTIQPDFAEAHLALGEKHLAENKLEEALACCQRALQLKPDYADGYSQMGTVFYTQGLLDEAQASFRRSLELNPNQPAVYYNLGIVLHEQGRPEEAVAGFQQALQFGSGAARIHYRLGLAQQDAEKMDVAATSYRKALQIKPHYAEAYAGLASVFQAAGNFREATDNYRQALRIRPDYAEAYHGMAAALALQGEEDEALRCCKKALNIQPDYIDVAALAATIAERSGAIEKAYAQLSSFLERGIDNVKLALAFADISPHLDRQVEAIDMMERLLQLDRPLAVEERRNLHFTLGKLYDIEHSFDKAFYHYRLGNELKPVAFDPEMHTVEIDSLIKIHNRDFMGRMPRASIRSDRPVFIVGMPRSGTSLVEQILASHPAVFGAGELGDIIRITNSLPNILGTDLHYPQCLSLLTCDKLDMLAQRYLHRLEEMSPDALRVTDKMPGNYMCLGLIELLFPGAHIIHCARDPLDTCLSCYFQDFPRGHSYAYDLSNLGVFYRNYQKLMQHWRQVLMIPIMEIRYEDLVADQELVSRHLVDFCGLEWDDRCLDFHGNRRFVATASYNQVRQPMYRNSVERWKNYERHIDPLKQELM